MNKKVKGKIIELSILAAVLLLVLGVKLFDYYTAEKEVVDLSESSTVAIPIEEEVEMISVHIVGAVHMPDVYEVPRDSRVKEVVEMAGGLTSEADEVGINMAGKVYDTQQIIIYKIGEAPSLLEENPIGSWTLKDLNEAGVERLTEISGIGESMAEKIIAYRDENGPFNSIDELLEVNGIGEKKLDSIREAFESSEKR